jgi:hypothetical protein
MLEPPIPDDEEKRLALLEACNIIYTPAEEAFDDVARLAAELCGTEIALITLSTPTTSGSRRAPVPPPPRRCVLLRRLGGASLFLVPPSAGDAHWKCGRHAIGRGSP